MNAEQIKRFVFAGYAVFTLRSKKTGTRFTFRVRASDDGKRFWVDVLSGFNNETDFQYIGWFNGKHLQEARHIVDAKSFTAAEWFLERLVMNYPVLEQLDFFHEGKCGRCGRTLTTPESVELGLGPECIKHV
jgi:hypothetical protein